MHQNTAHNPQTSGWLSLDGQTLAGRWQVRQRLAAGSYAEIHLARNLSPTGNEPQEVVIKTLNPSLRGGVDADLADTLTENFRREIEALSSLQHPNIARCFASGTARDAAGREFAYLVLEYLSGGNAEQFWREPVAFPQLLDYVGQVSAALSQVHAQGLLHRDVKPANLLLTADCRVIKLIDFGTARALADEVSQITVVGTAAYAAPEHYALPAAGSVRPLTPAADVYALAKTFYAFLCGGSPREFRQRPLTHWPAHLAGEAWAGAVLFVLARATRNQPEQRYQSVTEFYDALCAACDQTMVAARERSSTSARITMDLDGGRQPRPFAPFKLWRGIVAIAAACVLLLGVPLVWHGWRPDAPVPLAPAANTPAKPKPKPKPKTPPPRPKKPLRKR